MKKVFYLSLSVAILLSAQILSAQGLRVVYEEILSPARSGINDSISIENPEIRAIIEKQRQSLILKKQTELVINKGASLHSILQKNGVQDAEISVDNTILNVQRDIQTPTGDLLIYKNIITNETVIQEEFD
ncbi:MAG: hypothetical protein LBQ70_02590, partial [Prevotellaceae bacterium]|nr:hypothetical protein [Prevotellaceae bacterium]